MLAEICSMIGAGSGRQGTLDETNFNQVINALASIGQIDQVPSYREFFVGGPSDMRRPIQGGSVTAVDAPRPGGSSLIPTTP